MVKIPRQVVTALLLLLPFFGPALQAQDALSPRLQIGISMFPAIVAANKRLADNDGQPVPIYLVYRDNVHVAEQLVPRLIEIGKIRNHEIQAESISLAALFETEPDPASAIFITENLGDDLAELVAFAQRERVLLFSPFEGDVERGAMAGFRVTDKVLPAVNMTSLKQSNIYLKAFFLRIAVKHE